jgi:hypothetical protein
MGMANGMDNGEGERVCIYTVRDIEPDAWVVEKVEVAAGRLFTLCAW